MNNIKISISFSIPGSIMFQEKDSKGEPVRYNLNTIAVSDRKNSKTETLTYKTAKCKPCTQPINMTEEAYKDMMSTPIHNISLNHWKRMSEKQKVAEHLKDIQHDLHATSFEFTIYED